MPEFYVGRQPIFDARMSVVGYELLYRPHDGIRADVIDGDQATSQVILNSFMEIGLQKLAGERSVFINLTRNFVMNEELLPLDSRQVVLEILEDVEADEDLIQAIHSLSAKGYRIALDDFVFRESRRPLMEVADIIKIDLRALNQDELREHIDLARQYPVELLAEKVETPEEMEFCKELGFNYFQGYFLCCPRNIKGKRLPANRLNILRLMAKLQSPEIDIKELEDIIVQDVTLSYKLLRYINSAAFLGRAQINSIRHAIVYLGQRAIKNWATLITLAGIDDKPSELILTALTRGRMAELLADAKGMTDTDSAFTVGMFSVLDAMLDTPLPTLVPELPFSTEISEALLHHQGPYGSLLQSTIAYDRGEFEHVNCPGLDQELLTESYLAAVEWAEQTLDSIAAEGSR